MSRPLIPCGHCQADFLPRRAPCRGQRYCSRSCSSRARVGRPAQRSARRAGGASAHLAEIARLLALGSFERRPHGWRFGTRRIADHVVDHLVAAGRARIAGDRLHLVEAAP